MIASETPFLVTLQNNSWILYFFLCATVLDNDISCLVIKNIIARDARDRNISISNTASVVWKDRFNSPFILCPLYAIFDDLSKLHLYLI